MTYTYKNTRVIEPLQLKNLFESNGFHLTQEELFLMFLRSPYVLSCWDDEKLIGIIRSLDDENCFAYIDNLIVHKDYQGKGIEKRLLDFMLFGLRDFKYIHFIPQNRKQFRLCKKTGFSFKRGSYLTKINGRRI